MEDVAGGRKVQAFLGPLYLQPKVQGPDANAQAKANYAPDACLEMASLAAWARPHVSQQSLSVYTLAAVGSNHATHYPKQVHSA